MILPLVDIDALIDEEFSRDDDEWDGSADANRNSHCVRCRSNRVKPHQIGKVCKPCLDAMREEYARAGFHWKMRFSDEVHPDRGQYWREIKTGLLHRIVDMRSCGGCATGLPEFNLIPVGVGGDGVWLIATLISSRFKWERHESSVHHPRVVNSRSGKAGTPLQGGV